MVAGSLVGGRLTDRTSPGKMAAAGQAIAGATLVLIFLFSGSQATAAGLMLLCSFGMFFVSSPQQLLMVEVGRGGGEMIGSACVQVAFNLGNAFGAIIGQAVLNTGASYVWPSLAGVPFSLLAVTLLVVFFVRYEKRYRAPIEQETAAANAQMA